MGYKKNFRVHHGEHEFARGNCHINGIESFWSYAKRRLAKFNRFEIAWIVVHIDNHLIQQYFLVHSWLQNL